MSKQNTDNSRLDVVEERLTNIEKKIDLLLEKMEISVKECNKMGEHIDFIENVYDTVKKPLNFICDKVNIFSNNEQKQLLDVAPKNRILDTSCNENLDETSNYDSESDDNNYNDTYISENVASKLINEYQELID